MSASELLATLNGLGVELWIEGDRLRFRAPKGTLTPELREALGERKDEMLALLRQQAAESLTTIPLSYGQQALWFLNQVAPESPAYNVAFTARICSEVNVPALRLTLQALVDRHATLRAVFGAGENGKPVQVVRGYVETPFEQIDASGWSMEHLYQEVVRTYKLPFDLEDGPTMRTHLFTRAADDHVLLLNVHHIAVDGWSMWVLIDELRQLYPAFNTGESASVARPDATYEDYIQQQALTLGGEQGENLWAFWREQLAGELPTLNLPTDRPRPLIPTYRGASHVFMIDADLTARLKELARAEGATLYMVLLAAYQVLLSRYSGQDEVLVGSPTFGRGRAELARTVGYFVNMVAMRGDLSGEPTFRQLLGRIRQTVLAALDHQEFPFSLLVERLGGARDPSRSPIFQATFDLQRIHQFGALADLFVPNKVGSRVDLGGLDIEAYLMPQQEGQFDIMLQMVEVDEGLPGTFKYSADLFDEATIQRMQTHFIRLLEGIVTSPDQLIGKLPLLTEKERKYILLEWNDTQVDYDLSPCLHQFFEAQVERTPDAIAVDFEGQTLTYRELNARANQLAHHLRKLGITPDSLVGVCMERSLEMVISLYAILKAGGAYVPMDPEYPPARLAFMLQDAAVPVLLTQERLIPNLPAHGARLVVLDSGWGAIARESADNPSLQTTPDNLAYMIYTSGSTGNPKGAMNTHRGIVNRLLWMQDAYKLDATDRIMQKTPFSFDVSVWEFFWPLMVGARLVVARPGGHRDSGYLVDLIRSQQITTLHFVPSMLEQFVKEREVESCTSLRRVICSGEALPLELTERFFARLSAELHNLYGPTEAAVDVTWWECKPNSGLRGVPIGKPIANTQIYLLDPYMQPVPPGVAGELHIGGVQVARGYRNRPELNAEKFIPDPFSKQPGARLYKTGDLARHLPDGTIDYLGRIDHQIKLRGFRIELGEIETAITQYPGVRECVILLREDIPGDRRLVAYLTGQPAPSASDLRSYLRGKLPDYMVPSAFVTMDVMPLSPNGKVDRRLLPKPDLSTAERAAQMVTPQSQMETLIASAWQEALGISQVGLYDNFFDLGGHSLLAMQVITKLADATGLKMDPAYYRFQTLGQLAATYDEQLAQAKTAAPAEAQTGDGLGRKLFKALRRGRSG